MKSLICLILDRSGSMSNRVDDVIEGVNGFITEQKKLPDPASIAFVRFDSEAIERFRPMQNLKEVKPLTREDYQPRSGTPLLDAVGKTINQLDNDWKTERPERAIVVIVTDGAENASHEYSKEKIQALIRARQDSGQWAFVYLGANVDAFYEAANLGILFANTAGYSNTAAGTTAAYHTVSETVGTMRTRGSTVADNLGGNIDDKAHLTPQPPMKPHAWAAPSGAVQTWKPPA